MSELDDPVVVDFPLRGEWAAATTPTHGIPSHGTDMLGQRFAFDFVRIDDRKGFHLHPGTLRSYVIGGRTRDCHGWGQPVLAAFDGEVVEAVDRVPERAWLHIVRELALVLKSAVTFDPAKRGLDPVLGNHVILRTGETFALLAHLAPGTVAVKAGETVRAGDVIGRVGHTGNSTAPHLHVQLMDGGPAGGEGHPLCVRRVPLGARRAVGAGAARHPAQTREHPIRSGSDGLTPFAVPTTSPIRRRRCRATAGTRRRASRLSSASG